MNGPEREHVELAPWERDLFNLMVFTESYNDDRVQLSGAIEAVSRPLSNFVIDGFQRRVRTMWRTARPVT